METSHKHFEKKDIQTVLKHILLKDYLTRWANVFMKASISKPIKKCHFADCFAGRGSFEDGQEGSPLIAINNLFNLQREFQYSKECRFYIHTVELLESYHNMLKQMAEQSSYPSQIKNHCGEFKDHVVPLLKSTSGYPALYFVDPFGYKGVHMADILKILSERSHEVLINVMSYSLVRNYRIHNNQEELSDFFGVDELPDNIIEYIRMASNDDVLSNQKSRGLFEKLEDQILDLYVLKLKSSFSEPMYTLKKRIYSPLNPNVYFHLVFATRSRAGLVEMKNTMVAFEGLRIKAEDNYHEATNSRKMLYVDDLFSESSSLKVYDYSDFVDGIIKHFNNIETTYGKIVDYFLQYSPLTFRDIESQKSIYDYSTRLFKKNSYINSSSHSYANYRDADNVVMHIRLPSDYLSRIQGSDAQVEQLDLFNMG
ncbi:three-Cys-motif partner protein TcmP [Cohnella sp. GbtcB17]|uniref:three-Cys-motif partner protein TcmP n=1 Tax=Cohnella sp. GbtcB17 TaxID=2824762 RepID=UPI001C2F2E6A|nr:three-Cys-motif partner protein TcmP [Cohnella sp. GbtcB17]